MAESLSPQYDKAEFAPQWEYHRMTWDMFLVVREWAQEVARQEGYPVYLVGSTLWKLDARDLDVAIVLPVRDFETRYGVVPVDPEKLKRYVTTGAFNEQASLYQLNLAERIWFAKRVDCKIHPDTWFNDRDRLLLATPDSRARVRQWELPAIRPIREERTK